MGIIQFKEVNCKNCYKCIRGCPVKAISFRNNHAQVIEEECVLCGRCLQECPQNAKSVKSDVERVKKFIENNLRVYASIAPSFGPAFNIKKREQLIEIFKSLGFAGVQETAAGAAEVSLKYEKFLTERKMKNILTTACPTIVSLIEKHYPELIEQMAPVVSPMTAHAKMLKNKYGKDIKVVFIGPCLSKKGEAIDCGENELIDAVITFGELESWLEEGKFFKGYIREEEEIETKYNFDARFYPMPGGIIKSLDKNKKYDYKLAGFDGIDRCQSILEQIKNGGIKGYFFEMNSCIGGCLGGPCMNSGAGGFLEIKDKLLEYVEAFGSVHDFTTREEFYINLDRKFWDKSRTGRIPDEAAIDKILRETGKFSKEQELNCGGCGYPTCREKAIAVFNGKAEPHMCLPYMRERAESMSNIIIHSTPNAIIALTEELTIQEVNLSARKMFNLEKEELHGRSVFEVLDCFDIFEVKERERSILNNKYSYEKYNIVVEQSIMYLKEQRMIIIIMKDITREEKQQQNLHKMRYETAEIAQRVIDKQMRVVQEIASLLGETTAETKVALTKLKNSIQTETGE